MISVKDLMPVEKSFMINQWKDTYGILVLVCVKPSIHNTTKQILRREYKVTQQKKEGASIFLFREHPLMFEHEVAHTDDCKVHLENHGKPLRSHHPMKSSNKDCLLWVESGSRALHIIWVRDHPRDDLNLWHSSMKGKYIRADLSINLLCSHSSAGDLVVVRVPGGVILATLGQQVNHVPLILGEY